MKKVLISFLIMTLTLANISLVNISNVQAATNDDDVETSTDNTIKVSLENIRDIITDNSLDIKILDNNLKIAKEQYENAEDALDDAKEALDDAEDAEDAEDAAADTDNAEDTTNEVDVDTAKATVDEKETLKDNAKEAVKTAKSKYENGVEDKIIDAQDKYLTYLSDLADEKLKEDEVKSKENQLQTSKIQYEKGFISKNDYITSGQDNTDLTNELKKLKADVELARINLCNDLGISSNEDITFETDITENFKVISKINFNDDLNTMIDNNIDVKLQNDTVDDAEDAEDDYEDDNDDDDDQEDIYEYKVDNAKLTLKNLIKTTETSFTEQYNTLMNSYNTIQSSYAEIIQKQNEYQTAQIKYDYGFISKNAEDTGLDSEKLNFDTNMAKFIKDRNACYLQYLKYIEMKEGY